MQNNSVLQYESVNLLNAIAFNNSSTIEIENNEVILGVGSMVMDKNNKIEILKLKQTPTISEE